MQHHAYIALGSNLGDRLVNCCLGAKTLDQSNHSIVVKQSAYYETEPLEYLDQGWFINGVVQIKTILAPEALLQTIKSIEKKIGRIDGVRYGPRVLDMDILLYDELIMESSYLTIPHPKMHKRHFVLLPFCDINASLIHPVLKRSMQDLLDTLDKTGQTVRRYP